jgi:hypothetical protein
VSADTPAPQLAGCSVTHHHVPRCAVLGAPLPGSLAAQSTVHAVYPRGFTPGGPPPTPSPSRTPATITITAFPAPGALTPIRGRVTGLVAPNTHRVFLYLHAPDGGYWSKPQPGFSYAVGDDGTFALPDWASYPAGDGAFTDMAIFIVVQGTAMPSGEGA